MTKPDGAGFILSASSIAEIVPSTSSTANLEYANLCKERANEQWGREANQANRSGCFEQISAVSWLQSV